MNRFNGFTFVECLLAIMIFALMVTSVHSVFRAGVKAERKGEELISDIREIRWNVRDLSREIHNIVTLPADYFEGEVDQMSFLTLLPAYADGGMEDVELCQVRYRFEKNGTPEAAKLVKTTLRLGVNEVDTLEIQDVILDLALSFARTGEGGERAWLTSWEGQPGLPSAIGIEITTGDSLGSGGVTHLNRIIPVMSDRDIGPEGY